MPRGKRKTCQQEVHTLAHRTRKAGAQVAQDLSSREVSSVQSLRDAWTYQTGYTPRGCCGPTTGGTFIPGGTQLRGHKGGRGLTSQNQEGRGQVHLNAIPALVPSRSWTHPDVAGTALSAHGLSEGNLLSWTGPPAPAELAMEPKDKVMSPFQKAYLLGESSHCTQLSAGKRSLQQAPLSCL